MIDIKDIERAREVITGRVRRTPVFSSTRIGDQVGTRLFLKAEQLQQTGSFKVRGALNKISSLNEKERQRGVIAVSAGNHAQGVAWAATAAGVKSTIVMASSASENKIKATRGYGAEVILVDGGISAAFDQVEKFQQERGLTLVHPFDDPLIIAGQGTLGLEIIEDVPDVDAIVVGIGGGGVIAGIAIAAKTLKPDIRVYGVEPENAAVMLRSWEAGKPLEMNPETIADGLASPQAGKLTYEITRQYLDDIVTVSDAEIISALKDLLTYAKLYTEPAGAAPVAALLAGKIPITPEQTTVALLSGGNFDLEALKGIL